MDLVLELLDQHPGLFALGLLLLCGLGLPPWSEEIIILGTGYFVANGALSFHEAIGWCFAGILAGDSIIYSLGSAVGERVYGWPLLRRHMGMKQRARFNRRFRAEGTKAVFLARFIPGYRMVAYFVAGNLGMPYWKFVFLDSIGAALTVPISVWLGKLFADNLNHALDLIHQFEVPLAISGGVILLLLLWQSGRQRQLRLRALLRLREQRRKTGKTNQKVENPASDGHDESHGSG